MQDSFLPYYAQRLRQINPNISDVEIMESYNAHKRGELPAPGPTPPSTVNTQLKNPYAGTPMEARNPLNPQAEIMSQFDPERLKAAQRQQLETYRGTLPSRMAGQLMAASAGLSPDKALWESIDKQNMLQSITAEKDLTEKAISALAGAKSEQDRMKQAGEYELSQKKGAEDLAQLKQKTELGQFSVDTQRRLNDPSSPETKLAKIMLVDQFKAAGVAVPKDIDMNNVTAQQLMGFMDPKVLEAYKTKTGIKEVQATTAKTQAEIPGVQAESQIKQAVANTVAPVQGGVTPGSGAPVVSPRSTNAVGPLGWNGNPNNLNDTSQMRPNDKIAVWKEQLAKTTDPADRAALENLIKLESVKPGANLPSAQTPNVPQPGAKPTLQMPAGSNMSISAGGVNITPNAAVTGEQANAASESAKDRKKSDVISTYDLNNLSTSIAKRSADAVKSGKISPTGNMQEILSRRVLGNESERLRTDINRLVDGRIALATASGNPAPDRNKEIERIMSLSPAAFQNELLAFNSQVQREGAIAQARSEHIARTNTVAGFSPSEIDNKIYMYNPDTGRGGLVSPEKMESLRKKGFLTLNELNR